MKINTLRLEDFGPYRGENEFDLRTTPDKPIILFGGQNGAGKTTLFDAIQICLHGKSALGRRTSKSEYKKEIRQKLHDYGEEKATEAVVQLNFQYGKMGNIDQYTVERRWRDRGKSLSESLTIERNGEELTDLDEDQWETFLKELIPPGVSQLFFFDGEKVQELATAIEDESEFEESLHSLLGLEMVEQLNEDLSIYLTQKLEETGEEELAEKIESLRAEKDDLQSDLQEITNQLQDRRNELAEVSSRISKLEEELAQKGGAFAQQRDDLLDQREKLQTTIANLEDEIQAEAEAAFPFALAPDLCMQVKDRLQDETKIQNLNAVREEVVDELSAIADDTDLGLDDDEKTAVVEQLQESLSDRLAADAEPKLATQFSERQRSQMYRLVDEAVNDVPARLKRLTDQLEQKQEALARVERNLNRAPDEETISPIVDEISDLQEQRGRLKEQIEDLEVRQEELRTQISRLETGIDNRLKEKSKLENASNRSELASRSREALQEYRQELIDRKTTRLEDTLTERYQALSNKAEYYEHIHIDEDLRFTIETANGDFKDQSQLSAGERQIFATALLWALADISDRPLPFIVDTPLGRLDKDHRSNLVENFFPQAAHQVLVLSTDTEITEEYHDVLQSSIARQFHLDYDNSAGYTHVEQGYFETETSDDWNSDDAASDLEHATQTNLTEITNE